MKYFLMQFKRLARQLPGLVCVALCLTVGILAAIRLTVTHLSDTENSLPIPIALCGSTDSPFLQAGLELIAGFDASRYTVELLPMEQTAGEQALSRGDVAAMVVIPEAFLDAAMTGQILPLEFVSTARASGPVCLFKDEMTQAISQYLLYAQKGVFGIDVARREGVLPLASGADMDELSFQYIQRILARDRLFTPETIGAGDGLSLDLYLLCGLGVLLSALCCLTFGPKLLRRDTALEQMLCSRGADPLHLAGLTFLAYLLILSILLLPLLAVLLQLSGGAALSPVATVFRVLPAVLCIAALSYLLYALSGELIGGMLLQFLGMLALCFLSGCLYPVSFFPTGVQQAARWLPMGLARLQLSGCLTGRFSGTWALLGWCLLFAVLGIWVQARRYREVRL